MRLERILTIPITGFQYDRATKTRTPVQAHAELWVDARSVVEQLQGRALNSKRKQSVLGGGAIKVRVTSITPKA